MYISHFGLTEPPFSITPDPRYLYLSRQHREGLAHLLFGIRQPGGFVQLTGEVGTGKTILCRCLLDQLPPEVDAALIVNPRLTARELLAALCDELRIAYPAGTTSIKELVDALYRHLLAAHARGRRTVLIIDEAQNLLDRVLEQVRLLTNLETATEKLLQIILIGQPELLRLLAEPRLRQVAQRITARYHLRPFAEDETLAYVRHRLRVAGGRDDIFTRAALRAVHRRSRGIPRLVNVICDRALLGAYAHEQDRVTARMAVRAAREVAGGGGEWRSRSMAWAGGTGALAVALVAAGMFTASGRMPVRVTAVATPAVAPAEPPRARATDGGPRLADLLSGPEAGEEHAAFAAVYARWGLEYTRPASGLACPAGREAGLQCLFRSGSWSRLRRLDLPAVLSLVTPAGVRHRVAVVGLGEEEATLVLGGQERRVPLREIDPLWDGSFIVLWRPPAVGARIRAPGYRGRDVVWLRRQLDEVEGVKTGDASELYDEALAKRVAGFQRARLIEADGIVGEETLILMTLATSRVDRPSLSPGRGQ